MNYKTLAWCHLRAIRSLSEVVIVEHGRVAKLVRNGLGVEIYLRRSTAITCIYCTFATRCGVNSGYFRILS